jgi:glutamate-1-semialdehyde 2,1-aminomutase
VCSSDLARGIPHSFVGHPSMSGLYFAHDPPRTYRDWKGSDYAFYVATARVLHDQGVLCEPDSREPWFVSAAHDDSCLKDTLAGFEVAIDTTLQDPEVLPKGLASHGLAAGVSRKMPA